MPCKRTDGTLTVVRDDSGWLTGLAPLDDLSAPSLLEVDLLGTKVRCGSDFDHADARAAQHVEVFGV